MTDITQQLVELKDILLEYDMALCNSDCDMEEAEGRARKILGMEFLRDILAYIEGLEKRAEMNSKETDQ
ncbi:hypothetical protein [Yersinia ruckeri]|uniref:hypothetical protein n=1 Tax=Yersinia ruckeri TaxID=29486 RepID=UPI0020BDE459|nr:hypothetical protein [Yersinia ruckeri]MCK8586372.1 hypothetical protein [Yersinia ruckeri]MCW6615615.1 hypothetical protein [Yersinia ruckeri]